MSILFNLKFFTFPSLIPAVLDFKTFIINSSPFLKVAALIYYSSICFILRYSTRHNEKKKKNR